MTEREKRRVGGYDDPDVMAARDPETPARRLSELSRSSNIHVLRELAQNPRTLGIILDRLSRNKDPEVFCAVAGNPSTPRETLWDMHARVMCSLIINNYSLLEEHKTILEYSRNKIAGNPSTPPNLLRVLAQEGGGHVFCAVGDDRRELPGEPKRLHQTIADKTFPGSTHIYCIKSVAGNPSAPEGLLLKLFQSSDPDISRLAEKTLDARESAANATVGVPVPRVRTWRESAMVGAARGKLSREVSVWGPKTMAEKEKSQVGEYNDPDVMAARDPETPAKRLSELSRSSNIHVLRELAHNPRTLGIILDRLSHNKDPEVFCAVAGNPSTPRETLWDMHARVMCNLDANIYDLLEEHKTFLEYSRNKIAGNPSAPPNLLRVLAQEGGGHVFCAIGDARREPTGEFKNLYQTIAAKTFPGSMHIYCMKSVAGNTSAPKDLLLELFRLSNPDVSRLAGKTLDILESAAHAAVDAAAPAPAMGSATPSERGKLLREIEELRFYSRSESPYSRGLIARNPKTPPDVLHRMSVDINDDVVLGVAGNPAAPEHVLEFLSRSDGPEIRAMVASNEATSVDVLERLLVDSEPSVSLAAETRLRALAGPPIASDIPKTPAPHADDADDAPGPSP